MKLGWWTIFALQGVNFLILVWLLQRFLYKPVKTMVAQRKEEISRALAEASTEKESAQRLKREIEVESNQIGAKHQKMLDEVRMQLSAERQKMLEEARGEVKKIRDQALETLDRERIAAGNELFERTIAVATDLAQRLLREVALPSIENQFLGRVTNYLDHLSTDERARLFAQNGAKALLVTTAHPLGVEEQAQWRSQLAKRLGTDCSIQFSADPALIAGTIITFPHAMLRFNWRDSLTAALKEFHGNERPR